MLSIGKVGLAADQQLYYEQKVARGAEDYYAGRGEAPGRWAGSAADQLGLSGELDAGQLKAMMDGKHPVSGEQLAVRGPRSRTAAFDLTFSAPKSVSVLFAVGDERLSRAVVDAHEEAVAAALAYLEREACRIRRGHNGTRAEREAGDPRGWQRARPEPAGGSWPRRIGTACLGPRIRSCTRTWYARTSPRGVTAAGRHWMAARSTRTPRRRAAYTRRTCATRSASGCHGQRGARYGKGSLSSIRSRPRCGTNCPSAGAGFSSASVSSRRRG